MPPLRLTSLLQTALPHLSDDGRAVLSALGCLNGHPSCPKQLAEWLGFHDRYQLARVLRREGLPPLEVIGGWARLLYWVLEAETTGVSLRELAERERVDPAVAYRLVRRVTGQRWSEVRRDGLAVALLHFRDRCANGRSRRRQLRLPQPLAVAVGAPTRLALRPPLGRPASVPVRQVARPTPARRVVQTVSERAPMGGAPFDTAITAHGDILVTRPHGSAIDVLRLDPLRVEQTIRVGPAPTRVVTGSRSQWAYVTSQFAEAVCIVDLERKLQVGSISVPGHGLGAVMAPDGLTLFVTTNQDRLVAISSLQRATVSSAPVPLGNPELTVHPSGRWVYVPCWRAGVVVEVEATTLNVVRRFDVGGIAQEAVVSSDGQNLYVANEAGWLDAIHLPSGRRTATVDFGTAAFGVALNVDERYVFVSLLAGRVVVLQRQGLIERATIVTGGRPRHMVADPRGDAVVVANEAGWVDVLR